MGAINVNIKRDSGMDRNGCVPSSIVGAALERFCSELSPANSKKVVSTVKEIARVRQNIVVNMLAIGESLSRLRSDLGPDKFSHFTRSVLPGLGISRSTGYRWLGLAEKLGLIFPNPVIRKHLMAMTDGKGIVTSPTKDGKRDVLNVVLTPAAAAALKRLPPPPGRPGDAAECERWVCSFIKATGEARSRDRVAGHGQLEAQQALVRKFKRFAAHYGPQAAEDLCGMMDKALNRIVEMNTIFKLKSLGMTNIPPQKTELAVRHAAS